MNFQQQVAVFLSITVATDRGAESFVLLSLNWLVLALWSLLTLPSRTWSRLSLALARTSAAVDRWLTGAMLGRSVWAIG